MSALVDAPALVMRVVGGKRIASTEDKRIHK
jgi:hypothetical protein